MVSPPSRGVGGWDWNRVKRYVGLNTNKMPLDSLNDDFFKNPTWLYGKSDILKIVYCKFYVSNILIIFLLVKRIVKFHNQYVKWQKYLVQHTFSPYFRIAESKNLCWPFEKCRLTSQNGGQNDYPKNNIWEQTIFSTVH
jgi:hypothetical protein